MNALVLRVLKSGKHNVLSLPNGVELRELSVMHPAIADRMRRGEGILVMREGACVQKLQSVPRSIVCPTIEIVGENVIFPKQQGSPWFLPFMWSLPADCFDAGDELHILPAPV